MMNNRDIYQTDPATRKLVNEGVASVNDEKKTSQALAVLPLCQTSCRLY
ncbi:hypothetical protein [methane-oxidizing endosymbiont of Gigantopelta aegis]|nr:hypothetical protein [methane-oxidizing endosymbiont of Gigantopelta aegis]